MDDASRQRMKSMIEAMDKQSLNSVLILTKALVVRRMKDHESNNSTSIVNQELTDLSDRKGNENFLTKHDPQLISDLQTLISIYIKTGTYRFNEIIKDLYSEAGQILGNYLTAMKVLYSAFYTLRASDEEAEKMNFNLRSFTLESIIGVQTSQPNLEEPDQQSEVKHDENQEDGEPEDFLGRIGYDWIDYLKEHEKGYYRELKKSGTLYDVALKKEKEYYENVDELSSGNRYPPGGAEEVARMFLYPKLYP